jgi:hypothetical protein
VERGLELKHACFAVADELVLYRVPDLARGDVVVLGDVLKLVGDRAEYPGEDDDLHEVPGRVVEGWSIGENVIDEFVVF